MKGRPGFPGSARVPSYEYEICVTLVSEQSAAQYTEKKTYLRNRGYAGEHEKYGKTGHVVDLLREHLHIR
jgi:hypothetical protein